MHIRRHAYVACTTCHIAWWFVVGSSGLTTSATHVYCHLTTRQHTQFERNTTTTKTIITTEAAARKFCFWIFIYALISKLLLLMKHRALCSCDVIISFSIILLHMHLCCSLMQIFFFFLHLYSIRGSNARFSKFMIHFIQIIAFLNGFFFCFDFNIHDFVKDVYSIRSTEVQFYKSVFDSMWNIWIKNKSHWTLFITIARHSFKCNEIHFIVVAVLVLVRALWKRRLMNLKTYRLISSMIIPFERWMDDF